jgi:4Fe-4S ferredoxin
MAEQKTQLQVDLALEIHEDRFLYIQKTSEGFKELFYNYKRCCGCGICAEICPVNAIEIGPLKEIATGLEAPPVMIDHTKCTFCGMCANLCPINAITMKVNDEDLRELSEYPRLEHGVEFNEKCITCTICRDTCPHDAIKLNLSFPRKKDIAPFKEGVKGEIGVDPDKCTLCGLCAEFCPAFVLVEKEAAPEALMPYEALLVDEEQCDYCELCVKLCPEDAISVKGEKRGETPPVTGDISVDEELCTRCGWCEAVCPYEAVTVRQPFEGDISLIEENLEGCDPIGCHACFNVCPAKAWHIPPGKKIDVVEDFCIYCDACAKVCPVEAIDVKRLKVHHTKIPRRPWSKQWEDALQSLISGKRKKPDTTRTLAVEARPPPVEPPVEPPSVDRALLDAVQQKIDEITWLLEKASVRSAMEKKPPEEVRKVVRRQLQKKKMKK